MARFILDVAADQEVANQIIENVVRVIERDHFLKTNLSSIICIDKTNENQQNGCDEAYKNDLTIKQIETFKEYNRRSFARKPLDYSSPLDSDFELDWDNPEDRVSPYIEVYAYNKVSDRYYLLGYFGDGRASEILGDSLRAFNTFLESGRRVSTRRNTFSCNVNEIVKSIENNDLELIDWKGIEYWRDDIRYYYIEAALSNGINSITMMVYDPYLINILTQGIYGNMVAVQVVINGIERPVMIQAAHFGYIEKIDMGSSLYQVVGDHLKTLEDGKFFIEETFNIPSENLTLVLSEEYEKGDDMFKDLIAVVDNKPFLLYSPFSMGGEQAQERIDHITKSFINNNFKYLSFETEYDVPIDELVAKITKLTVSVQSIKEIKYKFMGKEYSLHNVHIYDVELAEHITLLVYDETLMNAIRFQIESAIEEAIKTLKDAGYSVSKNGTIV